MPSNDPIPPNSMPDPTPVPLCECGCYECRCGRSDCCCTPFLHMTPVAIGGSKPFAITETVREPIRTTIAGLDPRQQYELHYTDGRVVRIEPSA